MLSRRLEYYSNYICGKHLFYVIWGITKPIFTPHDGNTNSVSAGFEPMTKHKLLQDAISLKLLGG